MYNFVVRQVLCLSTRQFLITSRTYKSNLSFEKLFPNCKSLDVVSGPIKSPTSESTGNAKFNGFIPTDKLEIAHRHARGPGGQHNHNRINRDGYFVIFSDETRHRLLNQGQCLDRIRALIREASIVPKGLSDEEKQVIEDRKRVASNERVMRKRIQSLSKHERRPSSEDLG
ncbi:unnamed protein product [Rotaria magnacalcarata]|uniref:Mitochondrial ribosomal protein L58 n=1 Tax=Rotaria magnacalcarata TaxID=392030 RepID=A0A8S2PG78_9BILA|nr:unnamed protein product [Rotaria magnacalcarata]